MNLHKIAAVSLLGLSLAHPGWAEEVSDEIEVKDEHYSRYLGREFPQRVWWGDTHVQTYYSTDAGMVGVWARENTRASLWDALQRKEVFGSTGTRLQVRVIDVACSDGRPIKKGRCDGAVGNTVDIRTASYTNSIGEPMLSAWWEDPAFDPGQPAFYYVRVLESPTPTWTTYDAAMYGTALPDDMPATHQERAYTSSIWYSPGKASSD